MNTDIEPQPVLYEIKEPLGTGYTIAPTVTFKNVPPEEKTDEWVLRLRRSYRPKRHHVMLLSWREFWRSVVQQTLALFLAGLAWLLIIMLVLAIAAFLGATVYVRLVESGR